ncbi:hypothetical protein [Nocardia abscessus]|uniref:hypothetical protein n=1 Tax=Nocardia abscessus TaxID=120957 RepID=UPI002455F1A8|nr:hypothetical protein [Nocardia abscessus]
MTAEAQHGVALTRRVIESVRRAPGRSMFEPVAWVGHIPWVEGEARPMPQDALAGAVFPSGRPLSPSPREWMAFDVSLFERYGWFAPDGGFAPRPLDRLVDNELGQPWGETYEPLAERFPECFLLPGGSDSRRVLAVGQPDSEGEYPVLALDVDDMPYAGLMYPGFDVYAAAAAGLVHCEFETYTDLAGHPVYGRRMREHAVRGFAGQLCAEYPF